MPVETRNAEFPDLGAMANIYNQGIEERIATFESDEKSTKDIEHWLNSGFPVVVALQDGEVVAFAASFPYSARVCYRGIGEFSVYVNRESRGSGIGTTVMEALIREAKKHGIWKLVSRVFVENASSRKMLRNLGFREVGIYEKHAQLDKVWKDVVIVEYLILENIN